MADLKFSCPHCSQNITCDELWGGHELQCPSCQKTLLVPGQPAPATPPQPVQGTSFAPKPAGAAPRLSIGQAHAPAATGAGSHSSAPQRTIPIRNLTPPPPAKRSRVLKYLTAAVVLISLGGGGYFGFIWLSGMQAKANAKREAAE